MSQMPEAAIPDRADVAIVGGGITACSIAYHLSRRPGTDVVLIEKGVVGDGSTFHSAGIVTQFCADPVLVDLARESVRLYDRLAREMGAESGWHRVGGVRLASSTERLTHMRRLLRTIEAQGVRAGTISTAETLRLFPHMTFKDLYGAVYVPTDGYADPVALTRALARQAQANGARIFTGMRATGIERTAGGEVKGVYTLQGLLKADVVVLAAGMWTPRLAALAGIRLPVAPILHQYVVTAPSDDPPIPPGLPVLQDPDRRFYLRAAEGGFLVGGYCREAVVWSEPEVPWEYTHQLLPPDPAAFGSILQGARRRVPLLGKLAVRMGVRLPDGVTPDGQYLLGPHPACPGLYVACGASFNGVAAAGGVGRALAAWIVDGVPPIDPRLVDPTRFDGRFPDPEAMIREACHTYADAYQLG